jgi:hypothetical protein
MNAVEDQREAIAIARKRYVTLVTKAFITVLRAHRTTFRKNCGTRDNLEHFERNLTQADRDATGLLTDVDSSAVSYRRGENAWANIELGLDDGTVISFVIVEAQSGRAEDGTKS